MTSCPKHTFVEPWDHNGRCLLEVEGYLYEVKRIEGVPGTIWRTEFRAYDPHMPKGHRKAMAVVGRFTTLLRKLAR